jgi:hypothetical protein
MRSQGRGKGDEEFFFFFLRGFFYFFFFFWKGDEELRGNELDRERIK